MATLYLPQAPNGFVSTNSGQPQLPVQITINTTAPAAAPTPALPAPANPINWAAVTNRVLTFNLTLLRWTFIAVLAVVLVRGVWFQALWLAEHNVMPAETAQYRTQILQIADALYPGVRNDRINAEIAEASTYVGLAEQMFPGTTDAVRARTDLDQVFVTRDYADIRSARRSAEAAFKTGPLALQQRVASARTQAEQVISTMFEQSGLWQGNTGSLYTAAQELEAAGFFLQAEFFYLKATEEAFRYI